MKLGTRTALVVLTLLVAEAEGIAILPTFLHIIRGWLLAWPPSDAHFASMVGDLGWPLAVLLIAWLLRRPYIELLKGNRLWKAIAFIHACLGRP